MATIQLQPTDLPKAEKLLNQMLELLLMQKEYFQLSGTARKTGSAVQHKDATDLKKTCMGIEQLLIHELTVLKGRAQ